MTPEELEELRALAGQLSGTAYNENLAAIFGAALEHIDQQATALDEAEALIKKNVEMMNGYLARIEELEAQIIQQTGISASRMEERERLQKQIALLQKIAIEKGASVLFNGPWDSGLPGGATFGEIMHAARQTAREQLAKEHPEAFR